MESLDKDTSPAKEPSTPTASSSTVVAGTLHMKMKSEETALVPRKRSDMTVAEFKTPTIPVSKKKRIVLEEDQYAVVRIINL